MKTISQQVDEWIAEEQLPVRANLKPLKKYDPYRGWSEEEMTAYFDFIEWHLSQAHKLLLEIPVPDNKNNYLPIELDEFGNNVSAFNTHDFDRQYPFKFDKEHWRVRKILEYLKDLAIMHSSVTNEEDRADIMERFNNVVQRDFTERRDKLQRYYDKRGWQRPNSDKILSRITKLNMHIRKSKKIWEEFAYWE